MSGERREPWPAEHGRSELDPAASPDRWERSVAAIVHAAAPELRRRAASPGVAGVIGRWARPLVAAAAALIVVASAALLWPAGGDGGAGGVAGAGDAGSEGGPAGPEVRPARPTASLETAVYPAPVGAWMAGGETEPTVEEIVFSTSVGGERP